MDQYLLAAGFRHVLPYLHSHTTSLKPRWVGKPLLPVLQSEFGRSLPPSLLDRMLAEGCVSVCGATVRDPAFLLPPLRGAALRLVCRVHRHEPPILDAPLPVARAPGFLLVDKPPSWPCHPSGPHARNSLTRILEAQLGSGELRGAGGSGSEGGSGGEEAGASGGGGGAVRMLFRLDRLVSGLVVFALSAEACSAFHASGAAGDAHKIYAARLAGRVHPEALCASAGARGDRGLSLLHHASWPSLLRDWRLEGGGGGSSGDSGGSGEGAGAIDAFVGIGGRWGAAELLRGRSMEPPVELCIDYPLLPAPGRRGRFVAGAAPLPAPTPDAAIAAHGAGKACATRLVVLRYCPSSDTSFVLLRPLTGRTHQLRVHTQAISHPIANCPAYGGLPRFLNDKSDILPHVAAPSARPHMLAWVGAQGIAAAGEGKGVDAAAIAGCQWCAQLAGVTGAPEAELGADRCHRCRIWLHALSYSFAGGRFQAQLPPWWHDALE